MARGWESKSVEEQLAAKQEDSALFSHNERDLRTQQVEKARVARMRQQLDLQRESILSQRTSNPGRRAALEAALDQIEKQIADLG